MKPTVKAVHSPDIEEKLETWIPNDDEDVYLLLEVVIGPEGMDGGDVFSMVVTTYKGLTQRESGCILPTRGHLLIKYWSYNDIIQHIHDIVYSCGGTDWLDCSIKLNRFFFWEYEDMTVEVEVSQ